MTPEEAVPELRADDLPAWWPDGAMPERVSGPIGVFGAAILARVFAVGEETAGYRELVRRYGADPAWEALDDVAEALEAAADADAPADDLRTARRRLFGEARELARDATAAQVDGHHDLLRDVAHDIRSPLNSVLFLVEGLYNEHSGPLNATQRRQVGVVYSAAAALLNLVNDLLDFSRFLQGEASEVADVPFGLGSVIGNARHLVGPMASHHGANLEFEVEGARARRGDPQLLTRLLINFVSNGIEATGDGGRLSVRFQDAGAEALRVRVEDDGPGADVERVQELLDAPGPECWSRDLRGSTHGLGLLISGELVRRAGGEASVERLGDGGTRIDIRLPFPPVEEGEGG